MSDEQKETPISDRIERFWQYLETETAHIGVDLKRSIGTDAPDGPIIYWDGATFSDDVAKGLVSERKRLRALNAEMLVALKGVVAIADRKTMEFDRARAAITRAIEYQKT